MKSNTKFLLTFSVIYLVLSGILFLNVREKNSHLDLDSKEYYSSALRYSETNSFLEPARPGYIERFPYGYPFFIAMLFKLFGPNVSMVVLVQILLALLSGLLMFSISRRLFNETVAKISFVLFTFNLGFLVFPQFLLIETLLVFTLICFFDRFSRYIYNPSYKLLIESILILGISTLLKPAAFYYIFPVALLILILTRSIKHIFIALLCFYTPIASYITINGLSSGNYCLTRLDTESLVLWLWPKAIAERNKTTYEIERKKIEERLPNVQRDIQIVKKEFYYDILHNPLSFIKVGIKEVLKTFTGLFTTNLKVLTSNTTIGGDVSFFKTKATNIFMKIHEYISAGTESKTVIAIGYFEIFYNLIKYLFALIAIIYLLIQFRWKMLYLFGSHISYFAMVTLHDGCSRYRMPFEFTLIILAAVGIYALFKR